MTRFLTLVGLGAVLATVPAVPEAMNTPHAKLKTSLPAAGSTVSTPAEIRLTFTEPVELGLSKVTLQKAGKEMDVLSRITADQSAPETLVASVTQPLGPGSYTVQFKVAGDDGHPMGGSVTFTVK
ncbi:MAG TPA: copper homeostasis periplasmic binding protein CopC [Gemmatimonas sp.]|uniref:copper homeostasis periplasmic binding protein CopC n=1 Tax=Gemmatimonas sp. TaxID=1962908 RepID=UPI002ED95BEA